MFAVNLHVQYTVEGYRVVVGSTVTTTAIPLTKFYPTPEEALGALAAGDLRPSV